MIICLKFLMSHTNFQHNQIYEHLYVFNENEYQVYNKIYTSK